MTFDRPGPGGFLASLNYATVRNKPSLLHSPELCRMFQSSCHRAGFSIFCFFINQFLSRIFCTIQTYLSGMLFSMHRQISCLGTLSYVFSRSIKAMHSYSFLSMFFFNNSLRVNIASAVFIPCINPNCSSYGCFLPNLLLNNPLPQLYPLIISTLLDVPLLFINKYDGTIPLFFFWSNTLLKRSHNLLHLPL